MAEDGLYDYELENIFKTVKIAYYFNRFVGLSPYTYRKTEYGYRVESGRFEWLYLMVTVLFYTFLSLYSIFSVLADDTNFKVIGKYFIVIMAVGMLVTIFISIISLFILRHSMVKSFIFLAKIDHYFNINGITLNYTSSYREQIAFVFVLNGVNVLRVFVMLKTLTIDFVLQLTLFATVAVITVTKYKFISMVRNIRQRFEKLNELFEAQNRHKPRNVEECITSLKFLCRQHYRLFHILSKFNRLYGFLILFGTGVAFADSLFQSFYLYHILAYDVPDKTVWKIICPSYWLIIEIIDTIVLVQSCTATCNSVICEECN